MFVVSGRSGVIFVFLAFPGAQLQEFPREFLHPSAQKRKNTKMTKTNDFGNNFQFHAPEGKNYFQNH